MTDDISPAPLAEGRPWTLYVGDAQTLLAGLPGNSANCIVTSPPYWANGTTAWPASTAARTPPPTT